MYFLGRRVSEWADAGPLLESTAACAAITQDKLGQSRAIYPLLEDLPWPNPPTGLQGEVDRRAVTLSASSTTRFQAGRTSSQRSRSSVPR